MLNVKATVAPSKIHGLGLIARERIPAGTLVWEFFPGFDLVIAPEQFARLAGSAQEQVQHYGTLHELSGAFLLSAGDDRFTNHADAPNTTMDGFRSYASRPIEPGEEITADYGELQQLGRIQIPRQGFRP